MATTRQSGKAARKSVAKSTPRSSTSKVKATAAAPKRTTRRTADATAKGTSRTAAPKQPARARAVAAKAPAKSPAKAARTVTAKLATYRSMRDFGKTPEPQGKKSSTWKKKGNPFFVIQKHDASRLHYDFRLEVDGVLKSWAVPKGPSMNPGDKRLAVQTEDHPVDYADFEGIIPEDEYGGGTVIVWDAGPYRNLKQRGGREMPMSACHEKGQIEVWLEGKKVRGGFVLVHSRMGGQEKNWLLIKMKDSEAGSGDPVHDETQSVLSGRSIEEVASHPRRVWSSR